MYAHFVVNLMGDKESNVAIHSSLGKDNSEGRGRIKTRDPFEKPWRFTLCLLTLGK